LDDTMATTQVEHPPSLRTFHGSVKQSTYLATVAPRLHHAPQPPTCSFSHSSPPTHTFQLKFAFLFFLPISFKKLFFLVRCRSQNDTVDISRDAQLVSIESSFAAGRSAEHLDSLRHPTKPRLRAVATYEVLPDADVWANAYDLFRFSERPGERGPEVRFFCGHSFPGND
jgi:hypothetical protein